MQRSFYLNVGLSLQAVLSCRPCDSSLWLRNKSPHTLWLATTPGYYSMVSLGQHLGHGMAGFSALGFIGLKSRC